MYIPRVGDTSGRSYGQSWLFCITHTPSPLDSRSSRLEGARQEAGDVGGVTRWGSRHLGPIVLMYPT